MFFDTFRHVEDTKSIENDRKKKKIENKDAKIIQTLKQEAYHMITVWNVFRFILPSSP